jgi:hypothetical protein
MRTDVIGYFTMGFKDPSHGLSGRYPIAGSGEIKTLYGILHPRFFCNLRHLKLTKFYHNVIPVRQNTE